METLSALLAICAGNSPVSGEFPAQRPATRGFDVFFEQRPNKQLSKQSWGWWFEPHSPPLWRHSNANDRIQEAVSIQRCRLTRIGISMLKIRRSPDRLIFNMGIPIPAKDGLYIETGPRSYLTIGFLWAMQIVDGIDMLATLLQWNLSVTTTSIIKSITCDLFSSVF